MTDFVNGGRSRSLSQGFASTNRSILRARGASSSRGYASPAIAFDARGLSQTESEGRAVPTGHWAGVSVNASTSTAGSRFTGALGAKGLSQNETASRAGWTCTYPGWRAVSRPNDARARTGSRMAMRAGARAASASSARCRLGKLVESAGASGNLSYGFGIMRLRAYSGWDPVAPPAGVWTVVYPEN